MSKVSFLMRKFKEYYQKNNRNFPQVSSFSEREIAFIPWDKEVMERHMSFNYFENFLNQLVKNGPRHVYYSGALYKQPAMQKMEQKGYEKCDLIIDIDVDHFYTPCKDNHDYWQCKECSTNGRGVPIKCDNCGSMKLKRLNWMCEDCLNIAKSEIKKLIDKFLVPDFGIEYKNMLIAFSGHRGYHLKVESENLRKLNSEQRREIVDYLTGENLDFEVLGLKSRGKIIYGLSKDNIGWSRKILNELKDLLNRSNIEIEHFLRELKFNNRHIENFLKNKEDFLYNLNSSEESSWNLEGFNIEKWKVLLGGIAKRAGANIDEPVSIDIHRLIRYPGTLHGKTGLKVQELSIDELEDFNPLYETNKKLDPIAFNQPGVDINLEIIEEFVPATKMKGIAYGPYNKGDLISVPMYIAIYLLCKDVAIPKSMI